MPWLLKSKIGKQAEQDSFIGGKPKLPGRQTIPVCKLCSASQTFFFQIALPSGALWEGKTVAIYCCTSCASQDYLIPQMLTVPLANADIPSGFLVQYQNNFSFVVFPTIEGREVRDYHEIIGFREINLTKGEELGDFGKLGGAPIWIQEDESPKTYSGSIEMKFILQVAPNYRFKILKGVKPQVELDIMGDPAPSPLEYYQLFIGNALYLFGTVSGEALVYGITQV